MAAGWSGLEIDERRELSELSDLGELSAAWSCGFVGLARAPPAGAASRPAFAFRRFASFCFRFLAAFFNTNFLHFTSLHLTVSPHM